MKFTLFQKKVVFCIAFRIILTCKINLSFLLCSYLLLSPPSDSLFITQSLVDLPKRVHSTNLLVDKGVDVASGTTRKSPRLAERTSVLGIFPIHNFGSSLLEHPLPSDYEGNAETPSVSLLERKCKS